MTKIVNCKGIINKEINIVRNNIAKRKLKINTAILSVGNDNANNAYIRGAVRACTDVGISTQVISLPSSSTTLDVIKHIDKLNNDKNVHGILITLPLPKTLDRDAILQFVNPLKDIDCVTFINKGKLMVGQYTFTPCTAKSVVTILDNMNISIERKNIVMIGRSDTVGNPLSNILTKRNATVTTCHSYTKDLSQCLTHADIIISAVGKPKFITSKLLGKCKTNPVIVDVGINCVDGKICGDVDVADTKLLNKIQCTTSVPGGVGYVTSYMLAFAGYNAYNLQRYNEKYAVTEYTSEMYI